MKIFVKIHPNRRTGYLGISRFELYLLDLSGRFPPRVELGRFVGRSVGRVEVGRTVIGNVRLSFDSFFGEFGRGRRDDRPFATADAHSWADGWRCEGIKRWRTIATGGRRCYLQYHIMLHSVLK